MTLRTPADGLMVSAEDERDSWTALTRAGIEESSEGISRAVNALTFNSRVWLGCQRRPWTMTRA